MKKATILTLILFVGILCLTSCTTKIKTENNPKPQITKENSVKEKIENEKVSESFIANTKITNNFIKYKAGFGDDLKDISLNKLEIIDNKTLLNGLMLFSEQNLDNVKIKILPCSEMPLKTYSNEQVLGDCFEINPGTIYEYSKQDYLIFPTKIFEGISDDNFGHSEKEGGIYIRQFTDLEDRDDGKFYAGYYINKDKRYFSLFNPNSEEKDIVDMYLTEYIYFNGYYYIGFEDRGKMAKEIEQEFGEEIKNGYFKKDNKVFIKYGEDKFLLEGVSPNNFDSFYVDNDGYIRDENWIYFLKKEYGEPCGHHACTLKGITLTKIKEIKNKSFSFYDKEKQIIKINEDFYILNDKDIYIIDINNSRFNNLLSNEHILTEDKIIHLQNNKELENVDINTFKYVGGNYFADKDSLYIYGETIDFEFDYKTLEAFESGLLKDKNGIYMKFANKSNLVDLKSFEKVACKDRGCYFKDKNKVYYHWGDRNYFENFSADLETFEYIENGLAKDKNNLYQGSQIKEGVDIESLKQIGYYSNFIYFKDKTNYYKSAGSWIRKTDKKDIPFDKLTENK